MQPHIIIDAWDFEGFSSTCNNIAEHGTVGCHLRVKENGWLKVETSWGIEEFYPGDRIVILDVAAAILCGGDPINELTLNFLHELCHWAEDIHRPDREHGPIWNTFLALYIVEDNVNG